MRGPIALAWNGLPNYAARAIRAGIDALGEYVHVFGTVPDVPISGMDDILGRPINWIESGVKYRWREFGIDTPRLLFQTGWATPAFNYLASQVLDAGGRVVALVDNSWRLTPKQIIGAAIFRMYLRRRYSAVWVPGKCGRRLCRFLGMPNDRIYEGLYVSDPNLFVQGLPLIERQKQIIFVGRFVERKGLITLIEAFRRFHNLEPEWQLIAIGQGPLKTSLEKEKGIEVKSFLQPLEINTFLKTSRFLVLPSLVEHWGLVVNEAALSGCGLICSDAVGAAWDLVSSSNGLMFKAGSSDSCFDALLHAARKPIPWLVKAGDESRRAAQFFTCDEWANTFIRVIREVG